MPTKLIVTPDLDAKNQYLEEFYNSLKFKPINNPDLFIIPESTSLNIEKTKEVIEFFTLKPHQGKNRVVIVMDIKGFNEIAQNALLKTAEELSDQNFLIFLSDHEGNLIDTLRSRAEIIYLPMQSAVKDSKRAKQFLAGSVTERFDQIEKTKDRDQFLLEIIGLISQGDLSLKSQYGKLVLEAESNLNHNVNPRAVLEYLGLEFSENIG